MKGRFLLDVVVGQRTAVLELLASENEALLIGRNAFLVLDLGLDVVDRVGGLNLEGDGLAGDCGCALANGFFRGFSRAISRKSIKVRARLPLVANAWVTYGS